VLAGACIGLARGARLGPEYIAVAVFKGIALGVSMALILGWLDHDCREDWPFALSLVPA
jgi:hypothetical protein